MKHTKWRRLLSVLLTACMLLSMLSVSAFAEAGDWNPLTDPDDVKGTLVDNDTSSASTTLKTGKDGHLRAMPTLTSGYVSYNAMAYCGAKATSSDTDVLEVKSIEIGKWQGGVWNNADCLQVTVTPKKAGRAVVTMNFYYTFSQHSTPFNNPNAKWYYGTMQYTVTVTGDPVPDVTYTVTYTDGVEDEVIFENQVTENLLPGAVTPAFDDTPERKGYVFTGWTPEVAETVNADAIYTATWEEDANGNGEADETEEKYTVTYTDGVDDEEIFANQVTENLLSGAVTPEFDGTLERDGYIFTGWTPDVAEFVTENVTYTATWEEPKPDAPTMQELTDLYLKVAFTCDKNSSHSSSYIGYWGLTEARKEGVNFDIQKNDGSNSEFPAEEYPWQCYVSMDNNYWFELYKNNSSIKNVEARFATVDHVLADEDEVVGRMLYRNTKGYWSYDGWGNTFTFTVTHK